MIQGILNMHIGNVFQDWGGAWIWEILKEDDTYLRCEHSFECELDALNDLENKSHLIRSTLVLH